MSDEQKQKALEVLRAIAEMAAKGESITISGDWGFGSATVIDQAGAHTHVGSDYHENRDLAFAAFVGGMHDLLVFGRGLSWARQKRRKNRLTRSRQRLRVTPSA